MSHVCRFKKKNISGSHIKQRKKETGEFYFKVFFNPICLNLPPRMFYLTQYQYVQAIIISICNQNKTIKEIFSIVFLILHLQYAFYTNSAPHFGWGLFQLLSDHT